MLVAWMGYATLVTAILCVAALGAERLVAMWQAPRRFVWLAAVLAATIGPALLAVRRTPAPTTSPLMVATPPVPSAGGVSFVTTPTAPLARAVSFVAPPPPRVQTRDMRVAVAAGQLAAAVNRYAAAVWMAMSAAILLLFVVTLGCLASQRAGWRATSLGNVRVLVAPAVGPAVIGVVRPRIVIPAWSLSLDDGARALMLRHETEHIRAHDPLLLFVAAVLLTIFPWNAGLWIAVRRLRSAIEVDCDRRVLRRSPEPRAYGMLLITVSAHRGASPPFATALAKRQSLLERRIRDMTAIPPRRRILLSSLLVVLTLTATAAASIAPRPQSLRAEIPMTTTEPRRSPTLPRKDTVGAGQFNRSSTRAIHVAVPIARQPRMEKVIPVAPKPIAAESLGRAVSGVVTSAGTDTPVRNAEVGTVGLQLIGAPNFTCTNDRGEFRLRVPQGDVRLEVIHPDYKFALQDLTPTDSTAHFIGTRIQSPRVPRDSVRVKPWRERLVLQGKTPLGYFDQIIVIDGRVLSDSALSMFRPTTRCDR